MNNGILHFILDLNDNQCIGRDAVSLNKRTGRLDEHIKIQSNNDYFSYIRGIAQDAQIPQGQYENQNYYKHFLNNPNNYVDYSFGPQLSIFY